MKIKIFDATLRDGSHAIKHQFSKEDIANYCKDMDDVGVDAIIVGHGNGLGASSLQIGLSKLSDNEMLKVARENLKNTKLGVYMIPGFGTIQDNIEPALEIGVDLFKIGCHCTEANITKQHIQYLAQKNIPVYGVLMMYHLASTEKIVEEALKMQSYGANGVIIMDSAGASTPQMVKITIEALCEALSIEVGFHAHNNLSMAVANTYTAIQSGATIIDGTVRGFGAGAGNCQIEAIVALLQKVGIQLKINLFKMMDVSENIVKNFSENSLGIDDLSIVNGLAGTFSGFKLNVLRISNEFKVDPRQVLLEMGRKKLVAGQEDMIIEVAEKISKENESNSENYYLSSLL